ncbi:MAG: hypothetical protein FWG47_05025 [Propionibacteriaceae bacterium]|nr:hypothetical protein [Propionibacteriaceae bacterium]
MKWVLGSSELEVPDGVPTGHLVKLGWQPVRKPVRETPPEKPVEKIAPRKRK